MKHMTHVTKTLCHWYVLRLLFSILCVWHQKKQCFGKVETIFYCKYPTSKHLVPSLIIFKNTKHWWQIGGILIQIKVYALTIKKTSPQESPEWGSGEWCLIGPLAAIYFHSNMNPHPSSLTQTTASTPASTPRHWRLPFCAAKCI